jgi:hypothetical protein
MARTAMTMSPARVGRAVTAQGDDGTQGEGRRHGGDGAQGDHGTQGDYGAYKDGAEGDRSSYEHGVPVGDWMRYAVHGSNRTGPRGFSNSIGSM